MSSYGVTDEGFVAKPLQVIRDEVAASLRADIDAGLDLSAESVDGIRFLIFTEQLRQMWELMQSVYAAFDPDSAEGAAQDAIGALSGTLRDDADRSTVNCTVTTDQAVSVGVGELVVHVDGNTAARFSNSAAFTTAGAATPTVPFQAEDTGPVVANSGTLTEIVTPIVGVTAVTNPLDADLGADIESSDAMRLRREQELDAQGNATIDSIRAKLAKVTGVEAVLVFENDSGVVDGSGRPAKSIQAVVLGGADAAVAQALWDAKGAGIETHGAVSVTVKDSENNDQTVYFDRPSDVNIFVEIDLDIVDDDYPADGDDQVKAAIVTRGDALGIDVDVVAEYIKASAWSVSGVWDITGFRIGTTASPVGSSNVAIGDTQISKFDTSRVVVATNPVIPT